MRCLSLSILMKIAPIQGYVFVKYPVFASRQKMMFNDLLESLTLVKSCPQITRLEFIESTLYVNRSKLTQLPWGMEANSP